MKQNGQDVSGQIRQSQVSPTFGPGAMLDLPITPSGGWPRLLVCRRRGDPEPRSDRETQTAPGRDNAEALLPPPTRKTHGGADGHHGWQFPSGSLPKTWTLLTPLRPFVPGMLVHRLPSLGASSIDQNKKKRPVVSVRFVRACRAGHIR